MAIREIGIFRPGLSGHNGRPYPPIAISAAALASIVNAHANKFKMPRAVGIKRFNHLVRPNQMAFAVMLVVALDPNCRVYAAFAFELGEALGVFPDIGDHRDLIVRGHPLAGRARAEGEEMNIQKPLIASPPWTVEEEERLRSLVVQGQTALQIGAQLQRTENAIQHRMTKLGLRAKRVKSTRLVELGLKAKE